MYRCKAFEELVDDILDAGANPLCTSMAGKSEAGTHLGGACARCGRVGYCSKECQTAHWRAGHRAWCNGGG